VVPGDLTPPSLFTGEVVIREGTLAGHEKEKGHHPGWALLLEGDFFLMSPRRPGQDFAILGTTPTFGPLGNVQSVKGGYDAGFRVAAGVRLPEDGWEAMFRYTCFNSDSDVVVARPEGQSLFATLSNPLLPIAVNGAQASSLLNLNVFDFEFGKRSEMSEKTTLRWFFGPRYANLDQKFTAAYVGGDVDRDEVRRNTYFDGAGLRAGGEGSWKVLEHWGVYLRGSASLLAGKFRSSLSETANTAAVVNVSETDDRIVPVLDLGLGVSYQQGGLRLSVGYEFSNWFGMLDGLDFVDDVHPAKVGRRHGDLGFDGVMFRAEYLY
jgi:hypothetical protein